MYISCGFGFGVRETSLGDAHTVALMANRIKVIGGSFVYYMCERQSRVIRIDGVRILWNEGRATNVSQLSIDYRHLAVLR